MPLTDKEIRTYFKNIFGFRIRHVNLYRTALMHRSVSGLSQIGHRENNERLEYLGDAVLGAIIADFLCHKYPSATEGSLTQMRSKLVNRKQLGDLAHKLGLSDIVETAGNINSKNIPGNTFEAVVGAIYRDQGYKRTARILLDHIFLVHLDMDTVLEEDKDFKSRLLIWAQHNHHKVVFNHESEPDAHCELFRAHVSMDGEPLTEAVSNSVKGAEQRAAELAMEKLGI
ncbi:MAG: ribonuclease III [Bacteroidales bacterium]|jgi:ribonuclease-3|nr:ribonuclease III [Bacteroidales bacterium]MBR6175441.1 ribonuclease III [Bacteroidales bacterium]MBR6903472.1 ribonuclease III [Bacteroidales bacterium]MCR4873600.1 ribonuclease III [Bacteroidales bacterium]